MPTDPGLTDAQLIWAESPVGRAFMAEVRRFHDANEAHKPPAYRLPFSEEQERRAIREGCLASANNFAAAPREERKWPSHRS